MLLDIFWLVTDGHFGHAGQVDEGQCEDIRREDPKVDGDGRDSSITAGLGLGVFDDFLSNLVEIVKLFTRDVEEFAPFIRVDVRVGI